MKLILIQLLTAFFLTLGVNLTAQQFEKTTSELIQGSNPCAPNFVDTRDGKTYSTVLIGKQCWMAQNLDFGTFVPISTGQSATGTQKYCYADNPNNCSTNGYGGLYVWNEIMNGEKACNGNGSAHPACEKPVQGICPNGWHIPSHDEYTQLERTVGTSPDAFPYDNSTRGFLGKDEGANLKSTRFDKVPPSWYNGGTGPIQGSNLSGFNALQTGAVSEGQFTGLGYFGCWLWTSSELYETSAWRRMVYYNFSSINRNAPNKTNGNSLRCIKNNR